MEMCEATRGAWTTALGKAPADAEPGHGSDHASAANRGGLDPLPIRYHSQKGNHSLMGKIYVLNRFARLLQKQSYFERQLRQMGSQKRVICRRERREQTVPSALAGVFPGRSLPMP